MLKKLYCLKNYIFSDIINSINTTAATTKSIDNDQDSQVEELDPKRFEKYLILLKLINNQ